VPLPTPYVTNAGVLLVHEAKLEEQVQTALLLVREQLKQTPMHAKCGFVWPS
jgi:hypothetical protein